MARPPTGQVLERQGKRGRTFALRFRAYGQRQYVTTSAATQAEAEEELANVLADVRRGIWRLPASQPVVELPDEEPTLHEFASTWVADRKQDGLAPRSVEALEWALTYHLLPFFQSHRPSQITPAEVDRYRRAKVGEGTLSGRSINKTIAVLAQVLDEAIEKGYLTTNPARGKKRRLKVGKPRRTWLELDELRAILDAAGDRALIATMARAGLRVGEACRLHWRDVDLASSRLHVATSKTDAGVRMVDLSPDLLDELKAHKAGSRWPGESELVFPTRNGTMRDRHNVRSRVLLPAIERANAKLAKDEKPPIQAGVTNHTLRRTFASLLYEAGASPAYVMGQMGHESAALALEVYAKMMARSRDTGARMDGLVRGADWAQMGTNTLDELDAFSNKETTEAGNPLHERR